MPWPFAVPIYTFRLYLSQRDAPTCILCSGNNVDNPRHCSDGRLAEACSFLRNHCSVRNFSQLLSRTIVNTRVTHLVCVQLAVELYCKVNWNYATIQLTLQQNKRSMTGLYVLWLILSVYLFSYTSYRKVHKKVEKIKQLSKQIRNSWNKNTWSGCIAKIWFGQV